ncbi:MAG: aminotransferase class IV [Merismopediaceae bacterium]|nr:aminotransferase class IV [Merismopediaceae bacterium]
MYWLDGAWYEGDQITLSITEPGLIYGATLFTTLRVYQESLLHPLTHWSAHCDRLQNSLIELGWPICDWSEITAVSQQLAQIYPVLRIVIFPDGKVWITGRDLPQQLDHYQEQGITGWVAPYATFQRPIAALKTGNYLTAWLAFQSAIEQEAREAILVNGAGHWLETSTGNLWGWQKDTFYTPPTDGQILPGVMRSQLCHYLHSHPMTVQETVWDEALVQKLEGIAYSNSVVEIIPFQQIKLGEKILSFEVQHPALSRLKAYFQSSPY